MDIKASVWAFLRKISIPRFMGTPGHEQVEKEIINQMKNIPNITIQHQSFPAYSDSFPKVKILQILMGILILFLPLLYAKNAFKGAFIITIILMISAVMLSPFAKADHRRRMQKPDVIQGQNLIFNLKPKEATPKQTLIFLAHYDSISRPYPIILNALFFVGVYVGGYIYLVQNLIIGISVLFFNTPLGTWQLSLWGIGIGIILILLALDHPSNNSPGTLDNASGVALMYYLAHQLSTSPLKHTQLTFVATDAEELGNLGGEAFIEQHGPQLDKRTTFFVILDSIGCKQANRIVTGSKLPKRHFSPFLERIMKEMLNQTTLNNTLSPLKLFQFPPFLAIESDHNPVLDAKYEFILIGGVSLDYHSSRDNFQAIDQDKFFKICEFLEQFCYRFDNSK